MKASSPSGRLMLKRYPRFAELIEAGSDPEVFKRIRRAESTGASVVSLSGRARPLPRRLVHQCP